MMPIMVEVVDESQPVIGGEDFHWATALVDAKGTLKLSPAAKNRGCPSTLWMVNWLSIHLTELKSCGHEPCEYLPVMMSGDAIMVTSSLVH